MSTAREYKMLADNKTVKHKTSQVKNPFPIEKLPRALAHHIANFWSIEELAILGSLNKTGFRHYIDSYPVSKRVGTHEYTECLKKILHMLETEKLSDRNLLESRAELDQLQKEQNKNPCGFLIDGWATAFWCAAASLCTLGTTACFSTCCTCCSPVMNYLTVGSRFGDWLIFSCNFSQACKTLAWAPVAVECGICTAWGATCSGNHICNYGRDTVVRERSPRSCYSRCSQWQPCWETRGASNYSYTQFNSKLDSYNHLAQFAENSKGLYKQYFRMTKVVCQKYKEESIASSMTQEELLIQALSASITLPSREPLLSQAPTGELPNLSNNSNILFSRSQCYLEMKNMFDDTLSEPSNHSTSVPYVELS